MGLDQYLRAEMFVGGYGYAGEESRKRYLIMADAFGLEARSETNPFPSATASFTIGYWRKANAIHKWFVDNVQEGVDDCKPYYVSREQLKELRTLCHRVLLTAKTEKGKVVVGHHSVAGGPMEAMLEDGEVITNPDEVAELLPTQEGFFFGSTGYDAFYLDDAALTIAQIDKALEMDEQWDFYYQSSW